MGVKGGLNIASASLKNSSVDLSSMLGFHIGGFARTSITDQVAIQPELLFSLQGWESETFNVTRSLSYLTIPVAVKYYLVEQFNLHAGPQLGFLIYAKDDYEDSLTSTDFSMLFGAEYQINDQFGAGIRYNLGLNNILDNSETSDVKLRSRVFQISCSYKLGR